MITYLPRLTSERDSLTSAATELAEKAATRGPRSHVDGERLSPLVGEAMRRDRRSTHRIQRASREPACVRAAPRRTRGDRRATTRPSPDASEREFPLEARMGRTLREQRQRSATIPAPALAARRDALRARRAGRDHDRRIPRGRDPPVSCTRPPRTRTTSPLLDVIGKVTTSANAVSWVTWAPNPQAAATVVAEEGLKPEAAMTPTVVPGRFGDVRTLEGHHPTSPRRHSPDPLDGRKAAPARDRRRARKRGHGRAHRRAGPGRDRPARRDTSLPRSVSGVGTVQAAGYGNPNAVLLDPADWAALDIATVGNAGGATGQTSFWGMRAIAVPALPAGTAYVGNFGTAVQLFTPRHRRRVPHRLARGLLHP